MHHNLIPFLQVLYILLIILIKKEDLLLYSIRLCGLVEYYSFVVSLKEMVGYMNHTHNEYHILCPKVY